MSISGSSVVCFSSYRELPDHPEEKLQKLLWELLEKKFQDNPLAMAEAYSEEKAARVYYQKATTGRIDPDELFNDLIIWAQRELKDLPKAAYRAVAEI